VYRNIVAATIILILLLLGATTLSFLRERAQLEATLANLPATLEVQVSISKDFEKLEPTPAVDDSSLNEPSIIYLPVLFVGRADDSLDGSP
jgi:hypothetical protein